MGVGRRTAIQLLGVLVVASAVAGCDAGASGSSPTSTAGGALTSTAATTVALDEAGIDRKTRRPDPDATAIALTQMSVTRQGDHDQAVLTFTGSAVPGWAVQYVDTPVQNGTAKPLELPGKSWLEVLILETPSPFTNPAEYTGPPVAFDNDTPQINTIRFSNQASGIIQSFISLNGARPNFTVSSQSNPTRVVIDVAD